MDKIGIVHPGQMGISLAASARNTGHAVYWASESRGQSTRLRAESQALIDAGTLSALCQTCSLIVSICPPHAAEEVSNQVIENGFTGWYLDANAISPERAGCIGGALQAAGITFVDGGIIGGPAWQPGETWLYLSGREAERIAACFSSGPLETKVIGDEIGRASALKMCYAAYSKGTTALLSAALAASDALGVRDELMQQWDRDEAGLSEQVNQRVRRAALKAWRFEGEMHEIADTFRSAGLPGGLHQAAAELYHRLAGFKGAEQPPDIGAILDALLGKEGTP